MKERFIEIVESQRDPIRKLNLGREYLQEFILYISFIRKFNESLIFEGGTALRVLFGLKRFSEVLDFSVPERFDLDPLALKEALEQEISLAGYRVEIVGKKRGNLYHLSVKFLELDEVLLLPKGKKVTISLELDLAPPEGGNMEKSIAGKDFRFWVKHYDLSSLFAKKLHAVVFRPHVKGRDYYDLFWYLSQKPPVLPNEKLFFSAVAQTHPGKYERVKKLGWKRILKEKLERIDFARVRDDVLPFLENPGEVELLSKTTFMELI